jgi:amidase
MSEFIYKSAIELASLIRNKEATCTTVVEEHLGQIERHNPAVNAVVISMADEARKTAALCDEEAALGRLRGPLHGVPMTVKEQYWVKGTRSTLNSKMLENWTAPRDAVVVDRLRKAGAVILGKTNVPKNLTDYQVSGDLYPDGKNPYNTAYSPGGSSGGASAALASGMVPLELGGDFGGSIRIPSNYCGLFGLKPTENTVPGHGNAPRPRGSRGFVFHMAQAGPMARNPEDLELMWRIIRGPHSSDRATPRIDWEDAEDKQLSDYRVAWVDGWPSYESSEQVKGVIAGFVAQLTKEGCEVQSAAPPGDLHERSLAVFVRLFSRLISQDVPWFIKPFMRRSIRNGLLKGLHKFRGEFHGGFADSFLDYSETMGIRAGVVREWEDYFDDHDLLVCPMSFGPAFERCPIGTPITHDGKRMIYANYAWPYVACFNASGHPAMNIPLGLGQDGLPVGVQIVGPYWSEPKLIRFAKLVSRFTAGFVRPEGY